jgi:hypothetical protein
MGEAWRNFREGDILRVVKPVSDMEKDLARWEGHLYQFIRYSNPHGYAVCEQWVNGSRYGAYHLHPESLERAEGIRLCPICGVPVNLIGHTKDGRLIGSCQDAFTLEQWED